MKKEKNRVAERINYGEEDEMTIEGFLPTNWGILVFILLSVLSCGLFFILITWRKGILIRLTHRKCSLDQCTKVVLTDRYMQESVERVYRPTADEQRAIRGQCIHFYHKNLKYVWRAEFNQFVRLRGLEAEKCGLFYSMSQGLNSDEADFRLHLYGPNSVLVEKKPIWRIVLDTVLTPFYIYQMFIIIVWTAQLYWTFSLCIFTLSVFSISLTCYQTRKNSNVLREKMHSESEVTVVRDDKEVVISSRDLVPGDLLVLPSHCPFTMECDAVLLTGSCSVDESMLTGESVPVTKVVLTEDPTVLYSPVVHRKSTLLCGTKILHTQPSDGGHVKAVVLRTGFSTAKGELVRAILFPKPVNLKLKNDLLHCMIIFFVLGTLPMAYTGWVWGTNGSSSWEAFIRVIDVATFLVPPLLPSVITSTDAQGQRRLKKQGIFCLNPSRINYCGGLDLICFDKTGTLTEDSIQLSGVIPITDAKFRDALRNPANLTLDNDLLVTMASCHSLSLINDQAEGDSLELQTFDAVEFEMKNLKKLTEEQKATFTHQPERIVCPKGSQDTREWITTYRTFPFESQLQRMIVVSKKAIDEGDTYKICMKGAPEMVLSFCDPKTVPSDISELLETFTREGMRVLATASVTRNDLDFDTMMKAKREDLEKNLELNGILIFQNLLKPQTIPILKQLQEADIRCVMVTGDNLLTAMSVAHKCGLIKESESVIQVDAEKVAEGKEKLRVKYSYAKLPGFSEKLTMTHNGEALEEILLPVIRQSGKYHFAMDGKTFEMIRNFDYELLNRLVHKGTIFARMLPDQKLQLIEVFQEQGHQVGMCGDGANDCGALRTAHAGVSLSVAEASVASPFTYRESDISCVPTLIREGRANLTATLGSFKYQVCYTFVLLSAALILFWDGIHLSDGGYVMVDIILNMLPPMFMGTTAAYPYLVKQRPLRSIISFLPFASMISFIFIQIGYCLLGRALVMTQPWFEPFKFNPARAHHSERSHTVHAVMSINMWAYVIQAIIFNPGPPYRKSFFSNGKYVTIVALNSAFVLYLTMFAHEPILSYINFKPIESLDFKLMLLVLSFTNFIITYIIECVFINGFLQQYLWPKLKKYRPPKYKYEQLEIELSNMSNWPPIAMINKTETLEKRDAKIPVDAELQPINCDHKEFNSLSWTFKPQSSIESPSELNHLILNNNNREDPSSMIINNQKTVSFVTFGDAATRSKPNNSSLRQRVEDRDDQEDDDDDPTRTLKSNPDQ